MARPDMEKLTSNQNHTLIRILKHLGITADRVRSNQTFLHKELVDIREGNALLLFSEHTQESEISLQVKLNKPTSNAIDLSTGKTYPVKMVEQSGWHSLSVLVRPHKGRYLYFQNPQNGGTGI